MTISDRQAGHPRPAAPGHRSCSVIGALIVAVAGALWSIIDIAVTAVRLDDLRRDNRTGNHPWDWYPRRHNEIADAHQLRVMIVVAVASVVAGGLFVLGMRSVDPSRAIRICRWVGMGVAIWCVGCLVYGYRTLGDDFAVLTVVISTAAGIVAVSAVWLGAWSGTRRAERSSLRLSWTPAQLIAGIASFGLLLTAIILAMTDGSELCGVDAGRGATTAAVAASLSGAFFGLVLIMLRRWFLGLIGMLAGGGLALFLLLAMACLS